MSEINWPSRDPIGERGGVNLYGFVNNCSVGKIDAYGLDIVNVDHTTGSGYLTGDGDKIFAFLGTDGVCLSNPCVNTQLTVTLYLSFSTTFTENKFDEHTKAILKGDFKTVVTFDDDSSGSLHSENYKEDYEPTLSSTTISGDLEGKEEVGYVDCCGGEVKGSFKISFESNKAGDLTHAYNGEYRLVVEECGVIKESSVTMTSVIADPDIAIDRGWGGIPWLDPSVENMKFP